MLAISERNRGLRWAQPSALRMEYELRSRDSLVATLKFSGMFGTLATAESGDGSWTFKRVGFWRQQATVREQGADTDLAVFRNRTWSGGGELLFTDGRSFKATTKLWTTRLEFSSQRDEPLVRFSYGGVFRRAADVHVEDAARSKPELPLLVLFGWYLLVMLERDAAAVAVMG